MKENMTKVLALAMAASMALSACSSKPEEKPADTTPEQKPAETAPAKPEEKPAEAKPEKGEPIKDLVLYKTASSEIETFSILYSESSRDTQYLTNCYDSLIEVDSEGKVVPAIAEEYYTEDDGLTWTFKIRDGVKWVDVNGNIKGDCTSRDWATGLEWVMNYHKNQSSHTSQPSAMIAGAKDYYEWTKTLSQEEGYALDASDGSKFMEMVGIECPDDNTLIYHCPSSKPYFDSFPAWAGLYPLAQGMVDELGVDGTRSANNETIWYNGAYLMTSYIQGNEKVFEPNPEYWDKDCTRFNSVTMKMVESGDVAYQLFQSGEVDMVALNESNLKTISSDPNHEFYNYLVEWPTNYRSMQFHLNYSKNNEDGTPDNNWNYAVANEAFRKSWYYGLDLKEYYARTNPVNPMSCENYCYTTKGLAYTSDGTEYTELVKEKLGIPESNGETLARLDADKTAQYKKQAMEELSAIGVTFPVGVDYYIPGGNQASLDSANVLKQIFSDSLGDDYVTLNIKTYVSSQGKEVLTPKLHSFNISGWNPDFGDPENFLGQETYGNDSAYYSKDLSKINDVVETPETKALLDTYKEFTALADKASAISDDRDARYEAYAEAEAYFLDHALTIPCNYNVGWNLTKVDLSTKMNSKFGCQNEKMKNWATSTVPYTNEQVNGK